MRRSSLPVLALLSATLLAGSSAALASAEVRTVDDLAAVTVPVTTIDTPGRTGSNGIVKIRVGSSAPMLVMLDTGSVGLRLWDGAPPGAAMSTQRVQSTVGGQSLPGMLGKARMVIGTGATTRAVPFQLIDTDSAYIEQWKDVGISGILGVGVGRGALTNPLASLPGVRGQRWSIHFARGDGGERAGALVLGARAAPDPVLHFELPRSGVNADGVPLWDDHAALGCWTFGSRPEQCVPTWFDSGFTVMRIKGSAFARLPMTASNLLEPGTRVGLAAGGSAFVGHRFVAGRAGSRNLARVIPRGQPTINTGNSFYFDYVVTYDITTGTLNLSDPRPGGS